MNYWLDSITSLKKVSPDFSHLVLSDNSSPHNLDYGIRFVTEMQADAFHQCYEKYTRKSTK